MLAKYYIEVQNCEESSTWIINDDQISFMVSNLMDAGVCEFEGQILSVSDNSSNDSDSSDGSNGDEIQLEIKVYLLVCLIIYFLLIII